MNEQPSELLPTIFIRTPPAAVERTYEGMLADTEAKHLITTSFSLSKEESAAIDQVVGSPQTEYISRADFIRHACVELLNAWARSGFPDTFVADVANYVKQLRQGAQRLRIREQFADALQAYEVSLEDGAEVGDWSLVRETLSVLEGYIERTPEKYWKEHLRHTIAKNTSVQHSIERLYEASRTSPELRSDAQHWQRWLESLLT